MLNRISAICLAATLCLPVQAVAQENTFDIELLDAEQLEANSCRLFFRLRNGSGVALDQAEYQLAFVSKRDSGVTTAILRVPFGAYPEGKSQVRSVTLQNFPCTAMQEIVINDSTACVESGTGTDSDACMSTINASSRTAIQFGI